MSKSPHGIQGGATPLRSKRLRIGKISYANVWPIFYMLEKEADCLSYEFIDGVPSALNRMLRDGRIDISPSSSIEYLRNPDQYDIIEDHSISADGPIGSIFLFSTRPIESLDGQTILTSSQSETSAALIRIICKKFYGLSCRFASSSDQIGNALRSHTAYMLIGDDAISQTRQWPGLQIYDLGDLWKRHTGLPFTYALWLVRRACLKEAPEVISRFVHDLGKAKQSARENLRSIAASSPFRDMLPEDDLVAYWRGISYDFTPAHRKGLDLFRQYAAELGLLSTEPSS